MGKINGWKRLLFHPDLIKFRNEQYGPRVWSEFEIHAELFTIKLSALKKEKCLNMHLSAQYF